MNRKVKGKMNLADFENMALEALGYTPGYRLVLDNDEEITIPHPMTVNDDQQKAIGHIESGKDIEDLPEGEEPENQPVRLARAILGDDYPRFCAGGGKAMTVMLAWRLMSREMQDMVGEMGPKP